MTYGNNFYKVRASGAACVYDRILWRVESCLTNDSMNGTYISPFAFGCNGCKLPYLSMILKEIGGNCRSVCSSLHRADLEYRRTTRKTPTFWRVQSSHTGIGSR